MRIYKNRYYLMRAHPVFCSLPCLSGFQQRDKWEYYITTGHKAQNDRTGVVREYKPTGEGKFRLEDGHTPDSQPRANEWEALRWLDLNPYQRVTAV